jgi:hypothetical protein
MMGVMRGGARALGAWQAGKTKRYRLGRDWIQIKYRLGIDWIQTGHRLDTDWA